MNESTLQDARSGIASDHGDTDLPHVARRAFNNALIAPLELLGFWSAIVLPALYLPLLFAGLDSTAELVAFLFLLGLHVVALVVGHSHGTE